MASLKRRTSEAGSKVWDWWGGSIQDPWYRSSHPRATRTRFFIGEYSFDINFCQILRLYRKYLILKAEDRLIEALNQLYDRGKECGWKTPEDQQESIQHRPPQQWKDQSIVILILLHRPYKFLQGLDETLFELTSQITRISAHQMITNYYDIDLLMVYQIPDENLWIIVDTKKQIWSLPERWVHQDQYFTHLQQSILSYQT